MVYGKEGEFDAENLIDLLQALEKFQAVRDEGDGTAFKVDGVRGSKVVGAAGEIRGTQKIDLSERDTDIDGGRFRLSGTEGGALVTAAKEVETTNDERTVREALRFFFSPEGEVFREFMLEEVVTVVDASSREAAQELARSLGLNNLPLPSFVRAFNPGLSEQDRRVSINHHVSFFKLSIHVTDTSRSCASLQMVQQIRKLVQFLFGDYEGAAGTARLRKLIPIAREYAPQLRDFGKLLIARLTEKNLSRGLNWATEQLRSADSTSRTFGATTR